MENPGPLDFPYTIFQTFNRTAEFGRCAMFPNNLVIVYRAFDEGVGVIPQARGRYRHPSIARIFDEK